MVSYPVLRFRVLVSCLPLVWIAPLQAASSTVSGANGLTVTVDSSGTYTVTTTQPSWKFSGRTGFPLYNLTSGTGSDPMGPYSEIGFDFQSDAPRHGAIRSYFNQAAVLFSMTNSTDASNSVPFPSFTQFPKLPSHITYSGQFAFPTFFGFGEDSPWVFFDSDSNTFVLSPVTDAMVASTVWGPDGELTTGISSKIATLPGGFTHQSLLVIDTGINRAFDTWGQIMTGVRGKQRPANDADTTLKSLGYWTDAGSTYYYVTESPLNYVDTLTAVKAEFDQKGIPLGYLQLDSWFYPKGPGADWTDRLDGIYQYFGAPPLFATSLASFQQTLGIPLVTHSRWIDPKSPYRQQYRMSGNVSTDPLFWGDIAGYLATSGVIAYEQDWLSDQAQSNFTLTDTDAFMDNMAAAMTQQNLSMQYCMPTSRHFLQSTKYNNLTSIRASQDRFDHTRWRNFLYASRLAGALGIWPFTDVLMSAETDNLLLATLSAGPVGVGDRLGTVNAANLLHTVRADGVIVKPDAPLTPIDSSFQSDSHNLLAPLVASTYTDFGDLKAWYVFAYPQGSNIQANFRLSDIGLEQPAYLFNYFDGTGRVVKPTDIVSEPLDQGWVYHVIAPIGPSGIAVIGDTGHFVTLGKKRVTALTDDGTVHLSVAFAPGETVRTIEGFSPDVPVFAAVSGTIGSPTYDPGTLRFTIPVMPGDGGVASIQISMAPGQSSGPGTVIHNPTHISTNLKSSQ